MIENLILTALIGVINYLILQKIILQKDFIFVNYIYFTLGFFIGLLLVKYFYPDDVRGYTFTKKKIVIVSLMSFSILFFNAVKYFFDESFIERVKKLEIKVIMNINEDKFRKTQSIIAFSAISILQLFVIWSSVLRR